MKKLSAVLPVLGFTLFAFMVFLSSCKKEKTIYETVIKKDTVYVVKDTPITSQFLTSKGWKVDEKRGVSNGTAYYYKRGASGNTFNFDQDNVTLNSNKTGTYIDGAGASHSLTWDFVNNDTSHVSMIISNPAPLPSQTLYYKNIRVKNGNLYYNEYSTYNGNSFFGEAVRTPK